MRRPVRSPLEGYETTFATKAAGERAELRAVASGFRAHDDDRLRRAGGAVTERFPAPFALWPRPTVVAHRDLRSGAGRFGALTSTRCSTGGLR